jgi:hypothetical protein
MVDRTKGVVKYLGRPVREYMRDNHIDHADVQTGDLVQFEPNTPYLLMERRGYLAQFDGDNIYCIVQRRRITLIIERNGKEKR